MEGSGTAGGPTVRTGRGRAGGARRRNADGGLTFPPGWAVLAVVLGLMALVAALSAASVTQAGRPSATRLPDPHRAAHGGATLSPGSSPVTATSAPSAVTGSPLTAAPSARTGGTAATGSPVSAAPPTTTVPAPGPPTSTTDPATVTSGTAPGTLSGAAPGSPAAFPGEGNIAAPTVSATYPAPAGSTVTATATWAGPVGLTLSISCPGAPAASRTGPSPLRVAVADSGGSGVCEVMLAVEGATWSGTDSVAYFLTITPPAGT